MGKTCKKIKKVIDGRAKTIKDFAKYVSEGEVEVQIKKKSVSFYLKDKDNKDPPEFLFGLTGTIKAENLKVVENCTRCNSEARKKELDSIEDAVKALGGQSAILLWGVGGGLGLVVILQIWILVSRPAPRGDEPRSKSS